jgi:hypothetical protein
MTYYPQLNSNFIMTQSPYSVGLEYGTIVEDMETGMRWSFSRRGNVGLGGYSAGPLGKFFMSYASITDAEIAQLLTFFRAVRGKYHPFRLLDPGGNLLQYSEDFSQTYWDKSSGVSIVGSTTDPFGGSLATRLQATSSNSYLAAIVGPADGGLNGFVVNVSFWARSLVPSQDLFLGFVDSGFARVDGKTVHTSTSWRRYSYTTTLWNDNYFRAMIGGYATWNFSTLDVFGVQVSPMKGEGAYVKTPGNYGYHAKVRLDTDAFSQQAIGPNQNALVLPCVEYS